MALLDKCSLLTDAEIPADILGTYCSLKGERQSVEAMAVIHQSSTQATSVGGTKKLGKFKYREVSPEKRPAFLTFDMDVNQLETLVRGKIPSLDDFLPDLEVKLAKLRSILYSIKLVEDVATNAVWHEGRVQCIMELFLNYTFETCASNLEARAANKDLIEFSIENVNNVKEKWSGFPDLKCCIKTGDYDDIHKAVSTLEMKVPFGNFEPKLYHSKAMQPKQQLLGQAIGLLSDRPYTLSYLTDMFAISVMHFVPGKALLSSRVTCARTFCLFLLLMCCEISVADFDSLVSARTMCEVDLEDEEETEGMVESAAVGGDHATGLARRGGNPGPVTRSHRQAGKRCDAGLDSSGLVCGSLDCDEEAEHNRRLADITNIFRWEAKALGYTYFGPDELRQLHSGNENYRTSV